MRVKAGKVIEIGWQAGIGRTAWVECPPSIIPAPGRYVLAWSPEEPDEPLAARLFAARGAGGQFQAANPPTKWGPGTPLILRGPLGRGFTLPANLHRLALAVTGESHASLLPLVDAGLAAGAAVALFTNARPPNLPPAVEISPLAFLPESLTWADYLAMDLASPRELERSLLRSYLGFDRAPTALPCPAQALVHLPTPCGGIAGCGVCTVETRHGPKLGCRDGPVFDLIELLLE